MARRSPIASCVALISILGCVGCDRTDATTSSQGPHAPSATATTNSKATAIRQQHAMWYTSRGTGSLAAWMHLNYYERYDRYPEYGIALYCCGDRSDQGVSDVDLVRQSLRLIHREFRRAYLDGTIETYGLQSQAVSFTPAYICVVLDDISKGRYCGVVVSAEQLFRSAQADDLRVDEAMLEHDNIFEVVYPPGQSRQAYSPNQAHRYFIIERHMARRAGK